MEPITIAFVLVIVVLAVVHTFGEVLYKKGGMSAFPDLDQDSKSGSWIRFLTSPLVILSFIITFGVKLLYGIVLASAPLYQAGGLYLASIAVFSIVAGRLFFGEVLSRVQVFGFVLVSLGILLLV